ncbi:class II glutamine amidotransferase [Nocardia sp. NPDC127579]|uniref:class II glutamine amidotransferase n=1 Tax=Nocardia sp. NPDC127579 TaxID=3345402 RepID=UPI003642B096
MCRLFALTTGEERAQASFWLLDAANNLRHQSSAHPHGTGIGWFSLGNEPVLDRAPISALEGTYLEEIARNVRSHTYVCHIRFATAGKVDVRNCHPFTMRERLFAHNGCFRDKELIESWLDDRDRALIKGDTDSEVLAAWVTHEIERLGDTTAGIISAIRTVSEQVPVYSLNFLLAESGRVWALRYPDTEELWMLTPESGGFGESSDGRRVPAYVFASAKLDDNPHWTLLESGELVVTDGRTHESHHPFGALKAPLTLQDLEQSELAGRCVPTGDSGGNAGLAGPAETTAPDLMTCGSGCR